MKKRKVVFVCHYFPPQDNVGIRRVTFWANYFVNHGYEVTVLTTKKYNSELLYKQVSSSVNVIEFSFIKTTLVNKVINEEVEEAKLNKSDSSPLVGPLIYLKRSFINPIFGQIVDYRLISVFGFMAQYRLGINKSLVQKYVCSDSTVISTAPPWPVHILGVFLKSKLQAKFIADYRDPFSNNHMFSSLFTFLENKIDKYICRQADAVVTVSPSWVELYNQKADNVHLIRNGFDETMFIDNGSQATNKRSNSIKLNYFGTIEHPKRFPQSLFDYLVSSELDIEVCFYGKCPLVAEHLSKTPALNSKIKLKGHKPYNETIEIMKESSFNLVCESVGNPELSEKGLIPTKIYEYIACNRPIVALVDPESDILNLLSDSGLLAHSISDIKDLDSLFRKLEGYNHCYDVALDTSLLSRQRQALDLMSLEQKIHEVII